jgi:hypothetical protein
MKIIKKEYLSISESFLVLNDNKIYINTLNKLFLLLKLIIFEKYNAEETY